MESNEKIQLTLINERALTFKADDYKILRSKHRIIGKLIGTAVPYPRKVSLNGLPAYFTEYQTRFMLEMEIAEIVVKKSMRTPPTAEMKKAYKDYKKTLISESDESLINARLNTMREKMDFIIQGKRAKRLKAGEGN